MIEYTEGKKKLQKFSKSWLYGFERIVKQLCHGCIERANNDHGHRHTRYET